MTIPGVGHVLINSIRKREERGRIERPCSSENAFDRSWKGIGAVGSAKWSYLGMEQPDRTSRCLFKLDEVLEDGAK